MLRVNVLVACLCAATLVACGGADSETEDASSDDPGDDAEPTGETREGLQVSVEGCVINSFKPVKYGDAVWSAADVNTYYSTQNCWFSVEVQRYVPRVGWWTDAIENDYRAPHWPGTRLRAVRTPCRSGYYRTVGMASTNQFNPPYKESISTTVYIGC